MKVINRVTSRDGTHIAFDRTGTGPAVILVDAASGFRGFGPMPELAGKLDSQFTVITYDRRGRGESADTPPYAVEREVEDLQALIEAAGGTASLHGFSSGAILALHAAIAGLPIRKLSLLEPPLSLDEKENADTGLEKEITELTAAGRNGDAVMHFNESIGVPPEMLAGMRDAPFWPQLESVAPTLVYDLVISRSLPVKRVGEIRAETLIITSEASDDRLQAWADGLHDELPNASRRILPGEWHGVAADDLAPVLAEFFRE